LKSRQIRAKDPRLTLLDPFRPLFDDYPAASPRTKFSCKTALIP
jgi:hypothetical protein